MQGKKTGGRQKGTPNKASLAHAAKIAESGLTPLDYMLGILRDEGADVTRRDWAAEKAAPYIHPKLATVEQKGDLKFTVEVVRFGTPARKQG